MANFPDNNVELMRQYLSPALPRKIRNIRASLSSVLETVKEEVFDPSVGPLAEFPPNSVTTIKSSRLILFSFLSHEAVLGVPAELEIAYLKMNTENFNEALEDHLNSISPIPNLPSITEDIIVSALTPDTIRFNIKKVLDPNFPVTIRETHNLPGYSGRTFRFRERQELFLLLELLQKKANTPPQGSPEHAFRLGLLRAECNLGIGDFDTAIGMYNDLSNNTAFNDEQRKLIGIRTAAAHLLVGDKLFSGTRDTQSPELVQSISQYATAKAIVTALFDPNDPLALEVNNYADAQKEKIAGRFNFLGLTNGFVPLETNEFLRNATRLHINNSQIAVQQFQEFLSKANALEDLEQELQQEIQTAEPLKQQADERIFIAGEQVNDAEEQLLLLADQKEFLKSETVVNGLFSVLEFATALPTNPLEGIRIMKGMASTMMNYLARKAELDHNMIRAEIEKRIAGSQGRIAVLEREIVELRQEFVRNKLATTQGRELNKNLYYSLALIYRQLSERYIKEAVRLAYLWERAIAFRFRKPNLSIVPNFDPKRSVSVPTALNLIAGAALITEVAGKLELEEALPTEFDTTEITISLTENYPIEFNQFRQTGEMVFTLSQYDIDKLIPGTYDTRIIALAIEPKPHPPQPYTGSLIHSGSFLVRDLVSSPDPDSDPNARLIPTKEEIEAAMEQMPDGALFSLPVKGLIAFRLDHDTKQLSPATEQLKFNEDPDQVATRKLFERYGAAATWTLRLNLSNLNFLTDVELKFRLQFPETNEELRRKVLKLIKRYEEELTAGDELDQITIIFMRRSRFGEAFTRLASGQTSFELEAQDFDPGFTDLKIKTVIAQALNPDRRGVQGFHLIISKQDASFTLDRVTGATGFSEDVNAPIPVLDPSERFPVLGRWNIQLPDPAQFSQIDDLVLFFAYEFKSVNQ